MNKINVKMLMSFFLFFSYSLMVYSQEEVEKAETEVLEYFEESLAKKIRVVGSKEPNFVTLKRSPSSTLPKESLTAQEVFLKESDLADELSLKGKPIKISTSTTSGVYFYKLKYRKERKKRKDDERVLSFALLYSINPGRRVSSRRVSYTIIINEKDSDLFAEICGLKKKTREPTLLSGLRKIFKDEAREQITSTLIGANTLEVLVFEGEFVRRW